MSYQDAVVQHRYGDYTHLCSAVGRAGSRIRSRSLGLSFRARSLACEILGASFYRDLGLAVCCVKFGVPWVWKLLGVPWCL